jgi:hypothetical protein
MIMENIRFSSSQLYQKFLELKEEFDQLLPQKDVYLEKDIPLENVHIVYKSPYIASEKKNYLLKLINKKLSEAIDAIKSATIVESWQIKVGSWQTKRCQKSSFSSHGTRLA